MIIIYIIIGALIHFICYKLCWEILKDKVDYNRADVWLDYKEGWLICFGGILFPLTFILIGLYLLFIISSKLWDKYNLTEKFNELKQKGGFD